MIATKPSLLAASSIYLALKMAKVNQNWIDPLLENCNQPEADIRVCAKQLFLLFTKAKTSSLQAVRKKFSMPKFGEVAKIQVDSSANNAPPKTESEAEKNHPLPK